MRKLGVRNTVAWVAGLAGFAFLLVPQEAQLLPALGCFFLGTMLFD